MKDGRKKTRRDFLQQIGALGLAGFGAGALLTGCQSEGGGEAGGQEGGTAATGGGESPCTDVSGLTDAEKQTRVQLNYVNETPEPEKRCDNCMFWIAQQSGQPCGGCQIVKGPIDPAGYCVSWAAKQA